MCKGRVVGIVEDDAEMKACSLRKDKKLCRCWDLDFETGRV
jgi:hypothetical protein